MDIVFPSLAALAFSPDFAAWQWVLLVVAALLVGVSKTGVPGLGILFVALFANVFPDGKQATGIVLPLLIVGDLFAVLFYKRHMALRWFLKLFPWAVAGVIVGYFAMDYMSSRQSSIVIGVIIIGLTLVHLYRQWRARTVAAATVAKTTKTAAAMPTAADATTPSDAPETGKAAAITTAAISEVLMPAWFCPVIGLLVGFTTLVANAAGPLATLFFLAARLPKMEFVGTGAVFFMVLNWFKVPFMAHLNLINTESLKLNALLLPAILLGALAGRIILHRVNQRLFENIALWLGLLAGLKLLAG